MTQITHNGESWCVEVDGFYSDVYMPADPNTSTRDLEACAIFELEEYWGWQDAITEEFEVLR